MHALCVAWHPELKSAGRRRLFGYIYPARNQELLQRLQARKLTVVGARGPGGPPAPRPPCSWAWRPPRCAARGPRCAGH